jgi:metallo-beta-lactamase family protein
VNAVKITFIGGAKTVTGSCYLIETGEEKILVDCGMFQGSKQLEELNHQPWPFAPGDISYVLLTHAHIDHSGLLPKLKRDGFRGKIVCTKSTYDLCSIMLPDSGHIQELEAEWKNRKRSRQRRMLVKPLYTQMDAHNVLPHFISIPYHQKVEISPSVMIRLNDAGHILGSAIIEMWVIENGKRVKIVFSGDIGSAGQAIVRDPEMIEKADYLFVESTYGNRLHPRQAERTEQLLAVIREAKRDNGVIVIPAFAVGRTQELLFQLNKLFNREKIQDIPVYVDSPLAISATEVFQANPDYFDEEMSALINEGDNPLAFENLRFVSTQEESQKLNMIHGCAIIISASGMADAGRILHHLKHHLWKKNSHVVFVGYQAEGSLGRRLLNGAKHVRIMGQNIRVGANIHDLSAFSAHADKQQLLAWLKGFTHPPKQVFVVHGEEASANDFAETIRETLGWSAYVPSRGETVTIDENHFTLVENIDRSTTALSDAELQAYLKALDSNLEGLKLALSKHRLSVQQSLFLNEQLVKLSEKLEELDEQV